QAKALETAEDTVGRFLGGAKLSEVLTQSGARHRFVVAYTKDHGYQTKPGIVIPGFAVVTEMRQPDQLAKTLDTMLRDGALLASTQVNLKLVDEKVGNTKIVAYRFPENEKKLSNLAKADTSNIRFNFSPCFFRVGNQFVVCSTIELARELVGILEK